MCHKKTDFVEKSLHTLPLWSTPLLEELKYWYFITHQGKTGNWLVKLQKKNGEKNCLWQSPSEFLIGWMNRTILLVQVVLTDDESQIVIYNSSCLEVVLKLVQGFILMAATSAYFVI